VILVYFSWIKFAVALDDGLLVAVVVYIYSRSCLFGRGYRFRRARRTLRALLPLR
jgi:hypothetical protein